MLKQLLRKVYAGNSNTARWNSTVQEEQRQEMMARGF